MQKKGFKLEQVLNFRREMEKVRKLEFAAARHEFEGAAEKLRHEEEILDKLCCEFIDRQKELITAFELQLYNDFHQKKRGEVKDQRQTVATLGEKMSDRRNELLDAAKDKKVLESYKEKKVKAQHRELSERERAVLDEMSVQKKGLPKR